jgi:hypothetical protein
VSKEQLAAEIVDAEQAFADLELMRELRARTPALWSWRSFRLVQSRIMSRPISRRAAAWLLGFEGPAIDQLIAEGRLTPIGDQFVRLGDVFRFDRVRLQARAEAKRFAPPPKGPHLGLVLPEFDCSEEQLEPAF